jgi:two-component system, chemotaxis family, CheB/CheR fusion protein
MAIKRAKQSKKKASPGKGGGVSDARPVTPAGLPVPALCPVVALGSSAGGLEALMKFLEAMPSDSGLAFVVVHHLDPEHKSLMPELLSARTKMNVVFAANDVAVEANHVYVIPPNAFLALENGRLQLTEPDPGQSIRMPIDRFFKSLADEHREKSICIILSGAGTDGTLGLKAIKENGGLVIVEDPEEAAQSGMPQSAIKAGVADFILKPADMPDAILKYVGQPYFQKGGQPLLLGQKAKEILPKIIDYMKTETVHNFEHYKEGTLLRRIDRRMSLNHIEKPADYLTLLKASPSEVEQLSKDFLISVTTFFRDAEVYRNLESTIIPRLAKERNIDDPIRVWVAGCATGEEAYSIGMLLIEHLSEVQPRRKIQIFASDIDEEALAAAREGVYPESIGTYVSKDRLDRFFTKEDSYYRVLPELREIIVFATQNLLSDAPFSRLDLISCRNVLIYLDPAVQDRIISMFHFALRDQGVLVLGTSETVGAVNADFFKTVSKKERIFEKIARHRKTHFELPVAPITSFRGPTARNKPDTQSQVSLSEVTRRALIEHYSPAAILINSKSEGLYFSGPVDRYLKVPSGEASQDILSMVRNGLRTGLRTVIRQAVETNEACRSDSAQMTRNETRFPVVITARPIDTQNEILYLITFADHLEASVKVSDAPVSNADRAVINTLESELENVRRDLKNTIADYERTTEDLRAANEEAMSMNEEFQSTNEELETSKEELQSLNEELTTLNAQLQEKIEEQRKTASDLDNLLTSTDIATIFLDKNLSIKRFTEPATALFNLRATDIDRPFSDITQKVDDPELLSAAARVLSDLTPLTKDVAMGGDCWFSRRVLPYYTANKKVDGVVITFADVTELKRAEQAARNAQEYSETIVETIREPLIVLDEDLKVASANKAFFQAFQQDPSGAVGTSIFKLGDGQWDTPELRELLGKVIPQNEAVEAFEVDRDFLNVGRRIMVLNARKMISDDARPSRILLAIEDVTERRTSKEKLEARDAWLASIIKTVPDAIISIDSRGIVGTFSPGAEVIFGYQADEVIGQNIKLLMNKEDMSKHDSYLRDYLATGAKHIIGNSREVIGQKKDGTQIPLSLLVNELRYDDTRLFVGVLRDMTSDMQRLEELRRAQKMEAMGQLTGGVAHDFNNLLTIILGNLEIMSFKDKNKSLAPMIDAATEAAGLGADLTAELLAFGRRQPVNPVVLDLSAAVSEAKMLLHRTFRKEVEIHFVLEKAPWKTYADKGLITNALLNLCINSHDAMPKGGKLVIETNNVRIDEGSPHLKPGIFPGEYVKLTVSDTGKGMTSHVKDRALEPYFTTKEKGQGSGLGLSTVYGFASQSGGFVDIESEPGKGAAISIFLPRHIGSEKEVEPVASEMENISGGTETILVVEDDPRVRQVTLTRLQMLGYTTIEAENGPKALELINKSQHFDLLFTDVIMPGGMDGAQLVEAARLIKPDLRVLYASGYAEEVLELEKGGTLIRKPYSSAILAAKLRDVLDGQDGARVSGIKV